MLGLFRLGDGHGRGAGYTRMMDVREAPTISGPEPRPQLTHLETENVRLAARVADLAEVNQLLIQSTKQVSANADLDVFLESLVRVLADKIGASPVSLFEHDPAERTLTLRIHYENGILRRGPSGHEVPLFAAPFPTDVTPAWQEAVKTGGRFMVEEGLPHTAEFAWPGLIEWMTRIRVTEPGLIALFVGEEAVGALGISWTDGRRPRPSHRPLVEGLARHAAVALKLVKLAERSRAAAVASETEKAARERVADLSRANAALQRSTTSLMRQGDAHQFLETVLLDACAVCGAMSASIFRHDEKTRTLVMAAFVSDGERMDVATDPRLEMWREPFPTSIAAGWDTLAAGDIVWFDNHAANSSRWPASVAWHKRMGHRIVGMIPMLVGKTFLGFLGLCFSEPVPSTPARLEQARTLAGHAGLALQLIRLTGNLRRETAVVARLEERNRIARDLHDTLAQGFTGILAQLGVAEGATDSRELRHALERAAELARSSLAEARRSVSAMREEPARDPAMPLAPALKILLDRMTAGTALRAHISIAPSVPVLPTEVEEILQRVAQEALTNTLKHGGEGATEFSLELVCLEHHVCLIARDNGRGFDAQSETVQEGFGLVGMRERAALAGGVTTVRTTPGGGVEISVELPFECAPNE